VRFWNAIVSRFCVRPTSKRRFTKLVQVTMIYLISCDNPCTLLHPSYIHLLCWSPQGSCEVSVDQLPLSTNENAWSATVTDPQSCVWSGPNSHFTHENEGPWLLHSKISLWLKDGDRPSSLHIRKWRPKDPRKNIMEEESGMLWINVSWFAGICIRPTSKR
jgi:hypothetical protein